MSNIPAAAFVNTPVHMLDERRPIGRYHVGQTGTVNQYPVICAVDVVEHPSERGRMAQYVTTDPHATRCKDCRERMGLAGGR